MGSILNVGISPKLNQFEVKNKLESKEDNSQKKPKIKLNKSRDLKLKRKKPKKESKKNESKQFS